MLNDIKNEKLAVGMKQSKKAVLLNEVKYILAAEDVTEGLLNEIVGECTAKGIEVKKVATMIELGKSVGIDVGSAVVAVLK